MKHVESLVRTLPLVLAAGLMMAGCKQQAPATARTDQQIASDIQAKINAEQALSNQGIAVDVQNGRATLSGSTSDDASRALAANDAGSVEGVKTVINNLAVQPGRNTNAAQANPAPGNAGLADAGRNGELRNNEARNNSDRASRAQRREDRNQQDRNQQDRNIDRRNQQQVASTLPSAAPVQTQETVRTVPPPPAAPARPVARTITVPAGTTLPVRMTDSLDSATTQTGATFRGSLANDLVVDGMVAAPRGSTVIGRVVDARDAGHFKGSSLLSIELTTLDTHGQQIGLTTDAFSKDGTGRGRNTATKAGVGAGVGAIIGALAGGGKGAAIGAAAGGGLGAGSNGITRGQQVQIASETLVNFTLQAGFSVTTSQQLGGPRNYDSNQGPELQKR